MKNLIYRKAYYSFYSLLLTTLIIGCGPSSKVDKGATNKLAKYLFSENPHLLIDEDLSEYNVSMIEMFSRPERIKKSYPTEITDVEILEYGQENKEKEMPLKVKITGKGLSEDNPKEFQRIRIVYYGKNEFGKTQIRCLHHLAYEQ